VDARRPEAGRWRGAIHARVAVFAGNRLELFAAWLGITAHGALATTLNLLLGPNETAAIVDNLDPKVILTLAEHDGRAVASAAGRPVIDLADASSSRAEQFRPVGRAPSDHAVIAYTSGTTGPLPKGAVHSHRVLHGMIESTIAGLGLRAGDPILAFLPQFQLPAVACSGFTVLALGGSCLLLDRFDAPSVADALDQRAIRYFSSVPTALYDLVVHAEARGMRFESLDIVTVGGAPVSPELRERARAVGIPAGTVYGCTESAGGVAVERPDGPVHPGSCGAPVPGIAVSVRDQSFAECAVGVEGEVCIGADRALVEYWRNADATRDALRDGWFRTGDVGRFDEDGQLYVVDRIKDLIIRGGFNISPAEVERALTARSDVAEAAVLGRPDERLGQVPVAYVVAAQGAVLDPEDLRVYARQQLGPVKTPADIQVVAATFFPRSALGKVHKAALAQRLGWKMTTERGMTTWSG
jgi:acyl-CoA synthetase (AMP-forming)/AMP-acid ligase II